MKKFSTIGNMEIDAATYAIVEAIEGTTPLSGYIGSHPYGGPYCRALESAWAETFNIQHAVAVNSATSGLLAACMAIEVGHGDEVIVSPYTMSATAAAPKLLGAKIVWADIDPETYCLDPIEVGNAITARTKAVIVTNLFGQAAPLHKLRDICNDQGVYLIEDNAQAIFAKEYDKYTGTIGHMGVFSLNVHKHLQVGEGGVVVTGSSVLDEKLREAMNHGEMRGGILGLNLRMTEVTAAMAREQLHKAPEIMKRRIDIGKKISHEVLNQAVPIMWPTEREDCVHAFYAWGGQLLKEPKTGYLPKPFHRGYLTPLHKLPAFIRSAPAAYGPMEVTERIEKNMVLFEVCAFDPTDEEIIQMVKQLGRAF
jgi:perosamine synthetase